MAKKRVGTRYNDFMDRVENRRQRRANEKVKRKNNLRASKTKSYVEKTPAYATRLQAQGQLYTQKAKTKNIKAVGHAVAENTAGPTTAGAYAAVDERAEEKRNRAKSGVTTPTTSLMYQGSYDNDELESMPGGDTDFLYQRR